MGRMLDRKVPGTLLNTGDTFGQTRVLHEGQAQNIGMEAEIIPPKPRRLDEGEIAFFKDFLQDSLRHGFPSTLLQFLIDL